jgi:hypothetical protein
MAPGAYLSKGSDPEGAGVLNKREQSRADTFYKQLGMVAPAEQRTVPNNPRNFDSHKDAAFPVVASNLYGDWQQLRQGTAAFEVPPTPAATRLLAPSWQNNERLAMQEGLKLPQMQARTGFSPVQQAPNEWVLSNQPIARPGISGYEGAPLPAQPLQSFDDLMVVAQRGQAPMPASMDLDPRFAPYTVQGDPSMAQFPSIKKEMTSKGKPSSMPPSA